MADLFDHERYLLSLIIDENDFAPVAEAGIKPEHFLDPKAREVFKYIQAEKTKRGRIPGRLECLSNNPNYEFIVDDGSTFGSLIGHMQRHYALYTLSTALTEGVPLYEDGDADGLAALLTSALKKIYSDNNVLKDTDLTETTEERLAAYAKLREGESPFLGIPTGFDLVDRATLGLQGGQLVTLVGAPKAGKSTSLLLIAKRALEEGKKVLFIGFEMSTIEQEQRFDAIFTRTNHTKLRSGQLNDEEWKLFRRRLKTMEDMPSFIISSDSMSTTTLSGIEAKVDQHQPDLVIVDGVYMMQDENGENPGSPQALTNLTRGFKRLAQNKNLPFVITTQVLEWKMDKKRGITNNSIGYSSSFGQDSDAVIGVENTDDDTVKKIKIVISRNCGPVECFLRWDWSQGTFEEIDDPYAQEDDDAEDTAEATF